MKHPSGHHILQEAEQDMKTLFGKILFYLIGLIVIGLAVWGIISYLEGM